MKHNYFKHLFTALLLLCTTVATAHDFEVGGIYYNILSEEEKTVEVTFKGTSYYDSREYSGSVVIPETVVVSGTKNFDAWTSTNKSNSTTSQTSYTFYVEAGNILKFDWLVSSESNYDWLTITLDGTEIVKKSGTLSGSYEKTFDTAGSHTLVVKYTKDSSQSSGNDEGKIYNITLSGVGSVNDIVYRVTSIGNHAFYHCSGLTSITIPNSVTSIGENAFTHCSGLTNITIPNSVTSIGNYAFSWCSGLTSIKIPNSVTSIGESAFSECRGLKEVHTSDLAAWYGIDFGKNYANPLYYAKNLYLNGELVTELVIPDGVKEIKNYTFYGCSGLTSVVIPNSVTSIGIGAFWYCSGLTSITIPNSVTSIGGSAFRSCSGLTSVTIPNSVTSIGGAAFLGCTGLTSVTIPNSVTSIAAFSGCTGLTSITIPNSVTFIGEGAFSNCSGLTSITIPNSVTSIGYRAFEGCTGLTSITIPNSVTSIGEEAFYRCTGLTSVVIGNSVTSIVKYAFKGCSGLTSVTSLITADELFTIYPNVFSDVDKTTCTLYVPYGAKEKYAATDGWNEFVNIVELVEHDPETIGGRCGDNVIWSYEDGVLTISGSGAMYDSYTPWETYKNEIETIIIENGVTHIGSRAFSQYFSPVSIEIPGSVTSIGVEAFISSSGLTSITIPSSVTSIDDSAFGFCSGLETITVESGNIVYDSRDNCNAIIRRNDNTLVTGCQNTVIPSSVTTIAHYAFFGCQSLTSIVIPSSITRIYGDAFNMCLNLTSITSLIPAEDLYSINSNVFNSVDKTTCTLYVPYGAKETYASTAGWNEFTNIVELEPTATEVTVTIGQYGNATYCSPYALDFSNVEGLKAYAATGYDTATQVVTLTRVQSAKGGTGLFLKAEPGEYVIPVIKNSSYNTLNLLVGTLEQTTVNSTDGAMSNYKFTIADGDVAPMFYPFEDNTTFSAGKAYLQIPTAWLPATAQKSVSIRFDEGETTDIDELKGEIGKVKTIYDLSGRVVENPTSGIYIIDGKKVVVK